MAFMKQFNRAFFRDLWSLVKPYWWYSEERWVARGVFALVVVLNLLMVFISYRVTEWYNTFWNALQRYDAAAAWHELLIFVVLVTPYVIAAVYQGYLTQMLQIRWRQWLTKHYLDAWLAEGTYYQMQTLGDGTDNPDQRIAEDLASITSQTLGFVIGLLSSITTLLAFLAMLWGLSRQVAIPFHGAKLVIPGYLVWAAAVYAVIGTIVIAKVGRPLIQLNFDQQRFQADFRFSLVRLRENSESVALYSGEAREREQFLARFARVFGNFWQIMRRTRRLNWWVSGYGQAAIIFPILVSLPAYFSKAIQIGSIIQISSAFGQVQGALSFIVNAYGDLANWHAVVDRLRFFEQAMTHVRDIRKTHFKIARSDGAFLKVTDLSLRLPDGRELLRKFSAELRPGERLLIMGPSGSGKSTLVRALAGIWPFGDGDVALPESDVALCLPQRPYLPLGTLREVLVYPYGSAESDEGMGRVLDLAGLPQLFGQLAESRPWSHLLSQGEQQRLAFARTFLQRPTWIFMDEATSALDEPAERRLYEILAEELPRSGVVSVGHRSTMRAYHETCLLLRGDGSWSIESLPAGKPIRES